MARVFLTDKRVSAQRAPAIGRTELFDSNVSGLCIRVTDKGVKSWSLMYRHNGTQRRDTLGTYPKIGVAKARTLAGDALKFVGQGVDPRQVAAAAEASEAERLQDTVEVVAEDFISKYSSKLRWGEVTRIMRRDVVPHWTGRPMAEITRRDAITLIDGVAARAPIQANRTLQVLSIFFGWALDRDIIKADPTDRIRKPTKEISRERVLADPELSAFWVGCDALGWPFGPLLKLLALTGQRKSEIGDLQWSEINEAETVIELSGARYKTGKPHTVPLSKAALAIIDGLDKIGETPNYVFTTNGKTPVSGFSKAKANLDALMLAELQRDIPEAERGKVKLTPWVIHDLRRTARTNFSKLGIASDIGERVLGHTIGGVRATYDRHDFLPQMRDALERWSVHLHGIVAQKHENVVKLRRAR